MRILSWIFGVKDNSLEIALAMREADKEQDMMMQKVYDSFYEHDCKRQARMWLYEYQTHGRGYVRLRDPSLASLNLICGAGSKYENKPIDVHALANEMIAEYIAEHGEVLSDFELMLNRK